MTPHAILPSDVLDKRILDYILTVTERGRGWWSQEVDGTNLNRKDELTDYRLRMEGRRSVADLYHDAKSEPFAGSSNIGVGIESIFAEFLIPLLIANTHDLEPMLQVKVGHTRKMDEDRTTFHDNYHRYQVPAKRELLEYSTRELLTVGSCFHKWDYGRFWKQAEVELPVWMNPLTGQPQLQFDQGTGRMLPRPADPKTPEDQWPTDPETGAVLQIGNLKAVSNKLLREGPELVICPIERIGFPERETRPDPNVWEWVSEDFEVSPYWLLGREGDPFQGQLKLKKLFDWLAIDPNTLYHDPLRLATTKPIRLRAFQGKYPAAANGTPVEIMALIAVDAKLNLGWRPSPLSRRNYFNRQVWHSGTSPIGRGIPETVFSLRSAMDAILNQDVDAGNLYNHPPLLLSDMAVIEDEDYDETGPGSVWHLRDINGAKFLPTPIVQRNPVELLNWLMSNTQRIWGVSDLNLSAPSQSLSPNVKTATGINAVMNQGNIKFGHLTKRLSSVDTMEYQYVHDSFRLMQANPLTVTQQGNPIELDPSKREEYFNELFRVIAVGNGISTNPILRQQTLAQFLALMNQTQDPFVVGDLEVRKQLTDQLIASYGLDLTTKTPEQVQMMSVILPLLQTGPGQRIFPAAIQAVTNQVQMDAASQQNNGQANGQPANRIPA